MSMNHPSITTPTRHPTWCTSVSCGPDQWGDRHHEAAPVTWRPDFTDTDVTVVLIQDDVREWDGSTATRTGVRLLLSDELSANPDGSPVLAEVVLTLADAQSLGHALLLATAEAIRTPGAVDAQAFAEQIAADNRVCGARR